MLWFVYFFQIDDIRLPFKKGTMDDISREDEPSSAMDVTPSESTPADSMSSQGAKNIYAKEAELTIKYNSLDEDLKDVSYFQFETFFLLKFS